MPMTVWAACILPELPNAVEFVEYSIIANRGKDGPVEESSDGIVEYWSSHVPCTASGKIVPSKHAAVGHPETFAEITRIFQRR